MAQSSPNLMTLPCEVRQKILGHLLVSPFPTFKLHRSRWQYERMNLWLPTLRLCKPIYAEGIEILFKENTFEFKRPVEATSFFKVIAPYSGLLRHIKIEYYDGIVGSYEGDYLLGNHVTWGFQVSNKGTRDLAQDLLDWSEILEMLPLTLKTILIVPHDFVRDRCRHRQFSWDVTDRHYCRGCGLQQMALLHPVEAFLPPALADKAVISSTEMPLVHDPIDDEANKTTNLEARKDYLSRVAAGEVGYVYNHVTH